MPYMRRDGAAESPEAEMIEYTNSQMSSLIDEHIHSERNRAIMKRRLIDGICYEPLAEEFDLSDRRIKAIVYKEQEKLFKIIEQIEQAQQ